MGTFTIKTPDGKDYTIEGDNAEGALAALKKHLGTDAAVPKDNPDVAADLAKSSGAGLVKGTIGLLGMGGDAGSLVGAAVDRAGAALGASPENVERFKKIVGTAARIIPAGAVLQGPTSEGLRSDVEKVTGPLYEPKTTAGNYAQTVGEFVPAAIGGPESLLTRAITRVALPALASETAGQVTKGTTLEPYARTGAALATPAALSVARGTMAPIFANIEARRNPAGYAEGQVARAIHESGVSPDELSLRTIQAANEGQPQFTLADAMGNPGQRMLSTVARAPGEGRTAAVDALEARQAGQGRRVANALSEGFESPQTAAQTRDRLTAARDAAADAEYGAVRSDAAPVDISNVIDRIDQTLSPGVNRIANPGSGIANDTAEAALASLRSRLTDGKSNLTDFTAVQRVRGDLSDAIESARRAGQGNKARLLGGALRELDNSMEAASAGHRQANANFARASRNIDAVDQGRAAALRGRPEDTVPAFQGLEPEGQRAFRSGYADPLISDAQSAAVGANKARPLTNDAFRDEAAAMAPGNDLMQRRLGRENTMFETRQHAMGGSGTTMNANDDIAMSVDPHLIGQIVRGNWHGAVKTALAAGHNAFTGNTAEVRREVGRILLQNGANVSPDKLRQMVDQTVQRIQFAQHLARGMQVATPGAIAVTGPGARGDAQSR